LNCAPSASTSLDSAVIVGRRSLASYAFEPLRQMREAMASGRPAPRGN